MMLEQDQGGCHVVGDVLEHIAARLVHCGSQRWADLGAGALVEGRVMLIEVALVAPCATALSQPPGLTSGSEVRHKNPSMSGSQWRRSAPTRPGTRSRTDTTSTKNFRFLPRSNRYQNINPP
jgi:hypothetical protein